MTRPNVPSATIKDENFSFTRLLRSKLMKVMVEKFLYPEKNQHSQMNLEKIFRMQWQVYGA